MERCTWDAALASNLAGAWENLAIDVGKEIILPNVTGQQPRKAQVERQESLLGGGILHCMLNWWNSDQSCVR